MRNVMSLVAAAILLLPLSVHAQTQPPQALPASTLPDTGASGIAIIGVAVDDGTGDLTRYKRFRDFPDGFGVDRFRFDHSTENWIFTSGADRVGWNDQSFRGEFRSRGRLKVAFNWDQIPLYISTDTRTPYASDGAGVLRLDDRLRAATQAGLATMANFAARATPFAIDSYRHIGAFRVAYNAARGVNLDLNVRQTRQKGTMPLAGTFGFYDDVEIAAPMDRHTTDVDGGLEWSGARGLARVGYEGSWFTNNVPTLTWDNPLKLTDSTSATDYIYGLGGSRGRAALAPDNTLQAMTGAGSLKLPAASRATASVTVGEWRQDAALLPLTINTAVPETPLPRATAEANARTLAMNYTFTSRPASMLWLNAQYRYNDFDNRTPVFLAPISVNFDQTVAAGIPTEALSSKRWTGSFDASVTPLPFTALRAGYARESEERTFRIFEQTVEDVYRASADTNLTSFVTLRLSGERGKRRGARFDEELLIEAGEQPEVRHYDIADRDRHRLTTLVQLNLHKFVGVSGSVWTGKDDYVNSGFGLRDADSRAYNLGADLGQADRVSGTVYYTHERFTSLQHSRFVSVPGSAEFVNPSRDWSTTQGDRTRTLSAAVDVLKVIPRTELHVTFDGVRSEATYVYHTAPGWPVAALKPLPPLRNDLTSAMGDVRVWLSRRVAIGLLYRFEDYKVEDFAQSATTIDRLDTTGSLFLGYLYRPYRYSSAGARLICTW